MTEELLIVIAMLLLGALLDRVLPIVFETTRSKIQKLRWKAYVLKEYPNRDLIIRLKQGSEIKVLGKKHKVAGFVVIDHKGELSYEFWLKTDELERWLEFDESKIILWGEWLDPDLWGYLRAEEEQPEPILLKTVEEIKSPPIIKVGDVQAKIIDKCPSSRVKMIWGRWGSDTVFKETVYNYVDAIVTVKRKEATVDGRKLYVSLGAYGGQTIFTEFLVGNELQRGDIEISD